MPTGTVDNCINLTVEEFKQYHQNESINKNTNQKQVNYNESEDQKRVEPINLTRRLIAGIFLVVGGAILALQSIGVIGGYDIAEISFGVTSGFFGLMLAAALIIQGIYYIKTKCTYKNKDFEWVWFWVYGIAAFIIFGSQATRYFHDLLNFWPYFIIVFWLLGYRWGADQKDLINQSKVTPNIQTQVMIKAPRESIGDKADQIKKYKQLLDDNAISQAEYDEIKAEILNNK